MKQLLEITQYPLGQVENQQHEDDGENHGPVFSVDARDRSQGNNDGCSQHRTPKGKPTPEEAHDQYL